MSNAKAVAKWKRANPEAVKAAKKRYAASAEGKAVTAAYNAKYNKGTMLMVSLNKASPCTDCQGRYPSEVMEFDHREPGTKRADVARLVRKSKPSVVFAEISKCDLVCANCHRMRTTGRRLDEAEDK